MTTAKTLLITGVCIDGIGYQVCKHILSLQRVARSPTSWRIILAQCDPHSARAKRAQENLERLSSTVQGSIATYTCDLANLQSVRRCAAQIKQQEGSVDACVLNAGVVSNKYIVTQDGNELAYQVNHLGHFLLLHLLQDVICERVVFVNSSLHVKADAEYTIKSLSADVQREQGVSGMKQYGQAKLLTAYCLAHWHGIFGTKGVRVVLASPGFVPSTALSRDNAWPARFAMNWIIHYLPMARTLQQAGMTLSALVCGDEWSSLDNCYVDADLKEQKMNEDVYNETQARQVVAWSRKVCGID